MNPETQIPQTFKQIREDKRMTATQKMLKSNLLMIEEWKALDATLRGAFPTMQAPEPKAERGR